MHRYLLCRVCHVCVGWATLHTVYWYTYRSLYTSPNLFEYNKNYAYIPLEKRYWNNLNDTHDEPWIRCRNDVSRGSTFTVYVTVIWIVGFYLQCWTKNDRIFSRYLLAHPIPYIAAVNQPHLYKFGYMYIDKEKIIRGCVKSTRQINTYL